MFLQQVNGAASVFFSPVFNVLRKFDAEVCHLCRSTLANRASFPFCRSRRIEAQSVASGVTHLDWSAARVGAIAFLLLRDSRRTRRRLFAQQLNLCCQTFGGNREDVSECESVKAIGQIGGKVAAAVAF